MGAAANMADRMAQMESMDGAARCLETLRLQVSKNSRTSHFAMTRLIKFRNLISFVSICLRRSSPLIYI